jgi:hypothetical protein
VVNESTEDVVSRVILNSVAMGCILVAMEMWRGLRNKV